VSLPRHTADIVTQAIFRQPWSMSVRLVELGQLPTAQEAMGGSKNTGLIIPGYLSRIVDAERKDEGDAWRTEDRKGSVATPYETVGVATQVYGEASDVSTISEGK
jgi:hypothetical protein